MLCLYKSRTVACLSFHFLVMFRAFGPVGAFVLSAKVVGQFYDEEAEVYHVVGDAGEQTCLGRRCFEFSMLILAVVCLLGAALGAVLSVRTRQLYAQMKLHSRQ